MRGVPNNPVPCEICGRPGYPSNRRCRWHQPPTSKLKYPFDAKQDAIIRATWLEASNYRKLSRAIDDAVRRIGYPRYILKMRAQRLGLTYDVRHKWTAEEEKYLLDHAGTMPVRQMQKVLGHGWTKIMAKMGSMHLRTAVREGMGIEELGMALGVDYRKVAQWERNGWLRRVSATGRFLDRHVRAFVAAHPEQYDLRRVDQDWFKALLFPHAKCFTHVVRVDPTAWEGEMTA